MFSDVPPEDSDRAFLEGIAARFYKRTKVAAIAVSGLGFLVGAALAPSMFANALGDPRRLIASLFVPLGVAFFYAGATFAASVFFAPSGYFETEYGRGMLAMLQTRSAGFLRVVAVVLVALSLVMFFVALSQVVAWLNLVQMREAA